MDDKKFFNPLDKENLGNSIVEAVLKSEAVLISTIQPFQGAGIYLIYYRGNFSPYHPISVKNESDFTTPIYIGKAIPKGGRKGIEKLDSSGSLALYSRLTQHAKSLEQAENLDAGDFYCRYLPVDDIWIPLGESLLLQRFQPLWNQVVEGFGNHDPGKGRYGGQRPLWDQLHPGRSWAARCESAKLSSDEILALVAASISRGGSGNGE